MQSFSRSDLIVSHKFISVISFLFRIYQYTDMGSLFRTLIVLREFELGCPCLYLEHSNVEKVFITFMGQKYGHAFLVNAAQISCISKLCHISMYTVFKNSFFNPSCIQYNYPNCSCEGGAGTNLLHLNSGNFSILLHIERGMQKDFLNATPRTSCIQKEVTFQS